MLYCTLQRRCCDAMRRNRNPREKKQKPKTGVAQDTERGHARKSPKRSLLPYVREGNIEKRKKRTFVVHVPKLVEIQRIRREGRNNAMQSKKRKPSPLSFFPMEKKEIMPLMMMQPNAPLLCNSANCPDLESNEVGGTRSQSHTTCSRAPSASPKNPRESKRKKGQGIPLPRQSTHIRGGSDVK
jgi:hypothetical protein